MRQNIEKPYIGTINAQNLGISLEEDSDDDGEWTPQRDEVHEDEEDIFISKKRKIVKNSSIKSKKPRIQKVISKPTNDLTCKKCSKSFSRKDILTRHIKNF